MTAVRPLKPMATRALLIIISVLAVVRPALAQHEQHQQQPQLGKVTFPTSCNPKVQAEFERGVAMLHSYWFNYAGKTFRGVLEQDPTCAMAYWGIAMDLLGNTLSGPPSAQAARRRRHPIDTITRIPRKERRRSTCAAISAAPGR